MQKANIWRLMRGSDGVLKLPAAVGMVVTDYIVDKLEKLQGSADL